jgi:exosortase/archaeosortase family protein
MKAGDKAWLVGLAAAAAFVWLRDTSWVGEAGEVLPVLAALPLLAWLGAPWRLRNDGFSLNLPLVVAGGALLAAGAVLDLALPGAAACTLAFWAWAGRRCEPEDLPRLRRLLPLALVGFPWVMLDLQPVGWWFRISGARASEILFATLGFVVTRDGVHLQVQGLPVSVDPSCAGLKALQSLLVAGVVLAYVMLGTSRRYWLNLLLLPALAWLANTARIAALCAAAMTWGTAFAAGAFHKSGGLAVLVLMFGGCWLIFRLQSPRESPQ